MASPASPECSATPVDNRKRPLRARPTGKRFECTYRGCGKFYSRAEHLERHQLNRLDAPKELFECPVVGCALSFVRRDLYLRHRTRHEQQSRTAISNGLETTEPSTSIHTLQYHTDAAGVVPSTTTTPPHKDTLTHGTNGHEVIDLITAPYNTQEVTNTLPWSYASQESIPIQADRMNRDPVSLESRNDITMGILEDGLTDTSPSSIDEFAAWLFEGQIALQGQPSFLDLGMNSGFYPDDVQNPLMNNTNLASSSGETMLDGRATPVTQEQPSHNDRSGNMSVSRDKWVQLMTLIDTKLLDTASASNKTVQHTFNEELSSLSIASMKLYLDAYWNIFHGYLPILHHPTFSTEASHNYLLVAVLIVGSEMLTRQPGYAERGIEFTKTLAWNLRGHVLLHVDASPPGRLWVFQTLLLLEVHDKLFSSTELHERALVYFPTTLSLMRQSSTLFGRQVPKSPRLSQASGNNSTGATTELSVGFFAPKKPSISPPESWWEHWIIQEAIRRAAFAAFILDTTHSIMFGHSQTLVFHEIHLYLPCDQLLWSSNSPKEIGAVEFSLYANGVKSLSFLDGLRKMFNGQPCRTNNFGWLILLAGLLSIIGHMQQRDLLTSSLKYDLNSSSTEKWQPKIVHALQWWKRQHEENQKYLQATVLDWQRSTFPSEYHSGSDDDQDRTIVLYHLGHISIYITIPELGVIAGAAKILGRPVSPFERRMINEKITRWSSSPGAVQSLYHALELIKLILFRGISAKSRESNSDPLGDVKNAVPHYEAFYDKLPDRSWALYFATMIIWAYGFYQDGHLIPFPHQLEFPPETTPSADTHHLNHSQGLDSGSVSTDTTVPLDGRTQSHTWSIPLAVGSARNRDIQSYLKNIFPPSVTSPQDLHQHLQNVKGGRNQVIGLLSVVDHALAGSNWELLGEARQRLKSAATILKTEEGS